ncbi:glycoside hydrolase family 18 protein [Cucurbitaria berberidis CBS 394.84]|uniref:chitinase n=1 Tax=Cucurbitaria berberidis CBS 394.84 TaxID=1168544 RepID=A0A9P4L540_9PLEO|nr:glycoside hydrolase family 18 protein [Cucurbitaria berberidis CBS 394.84]KAF1841583.1 glycoside hydrolase family 18 protein [Cucurbitaria berberidis CBS 394.84]
MSPSNFSRAAFAAAILASGASAAYNPASTQNVAMYWGQGNAQIPLSDVCSDPSVDIVNIAFVNGFPQKVGDYPKTNFANACWGYYPDPNDKTKDSGLLKNCAGVGDAIKTCQNAGKKVLLSIGGGYPTDYYLPSQEVAEYFAEFLLNVFGPAPAGWTGPRPFGDAAVDGFDLDLEANAAQLPSSEYLYKNYDHFVTRVKSLRPSSLISGAPQCIVPDARLADAISKVPFDFIFTQFYNTDACSAARGYKEINKATTGFTFDAWVKWLLANSNNKNVKLYLGLAAGPDGLPVHKEDYLKPEQANALIAKYQKKWPAIFGGVMLWEATVSARNTAYSQSYGYWVKATLDGSFTSKYKPVVSSSSRASSSTRVSSTPISSSNRVSSTPISSSARVSSSSIRSSSVYVTSSSIRSSSSPASSTVVSSSVYVPSSARSSSASPASSKASSSIYVPVSSSTSVHVSSSASPVSSQASSSSYIQVSSSSSVYQVSSSASSSSEIHVSSSTSVYVSSSASSASTPAPASSSASSIGVSSSASSVGPSSSHVESSSVTVPHASESSSSVYSTNSPSIVYPVGTTKIVSPSASSTPVYPDASSIIPYPVYNASSTHGTGYPESTPKAASSTPCSTSSKVYPAESSSSKYPEAASSKAYPVESSFVYPVYPASTTKGGDYPAYPTSSSKGGNYPVYPASSSNGGDYPVYPASSSKGGDYPVYPVASSKSQDSYPSVTKKPEEYPSYPTGATTVTTITTAYVDICSTGLTTITTTIIKTVCGSCAKPTKKPEYPEGWTTSVYVDKTVTLTITKPVHASTNVPVYPAAPKPSSPSYPGSDKPVYPAEYPKKPEGKKPEYPVEHATSTLLQYVTLTKVAVPYTAVPYASSAIYTPVPQASSAVYTPVPQVSSAVYTPVPQVSSAVYTPVPQVSSAVYTPAPYVPVYGSKNGTSAYVPKPTGTGKPTMPSSYAPPEFEGAASRFGVGLTAVVAVVAAFFVL